MWARISLFVFLVCLYSANGRYTDKEIRELAKELKEVLENDIDQVEQTKHHEKRVINGQIAKMVWPWLVSMRIKEKRLFWTEDHHFCGAALVNSRWLVTAAHCFDDVPRDKLQDRDFLSDTFEARLGDRELAASIWEETKNFLANLWQKLPWGESDDLQDWINYEVDFEKVIIHPKYEPSGDKLWPNDIALVKLEEAVPDTPEDVSRIQSVDLPLQTDDLSWPRTGARCVLKGWGCEELGGPATEVANSATLEKVNDDSCSEAYSELILGTVPMTHRICAGKLATNEQELEQFATTGSSGCPGDSGGPLMCLDGDDWVLAGVTSFIISHEDYVTSFPTVFTRVTKYVDWINNNID